MKILWQSPPMTRMTLYDFHLSFVVYNFIFYSLEPEDSDDLQCADEDESNSHQHSSNRGKKTSKRGVSVRKNCAPSPAIQSEDDEA
jgi:hypothetical protein